MILVSGAAGKTGRAVISALVNQGKQVRGFSRNNRQAEELIKLGAAETFVGDLLKKEDILQATADITAIYHICPNVNAYEVAIGENMLQGAMLTNVERFVYHSVLHPQIEAMPHHWLKMRVEEKIFESGLPFTILQPAAYMQNLLGQLREITDLGVFKLPYGIKSKSSLVDLEDVAEVAAKVLIEPDHTGATYELVGSDFLSPTEISGIFSEVSGKEITAQEMTISEWREAAENAGISSYAIESLIKMFEHYDQYSLRGNQNVLEYLLGRKPTSFFEFLQREL